MERLKVEAIEQAQRTFIDLALRYGPRLLTAILILVVGLFIVRRIAHTALTWMAQRGMEPPLRTLLTRVMSATLFLCCLLLALQNLGVELLPLLAGFGVAGVGLGLAVQGVLSNLVAGLTIIFTNPYRIGEYISIAGVEGQVLQISLFSTHLGHYDRSVIVIPNRKIVGEILHNYGKKRQLQLKVSVAYGTDLVRALAVISGLLERSPRVIKEIQPVLGVSTLADSSIELSVCPWVEVSDYVTAGSEIYQGIVDAFRSAAITIPYPRQEVRLLSAPESDRS